MPAGRAKTRRWHLPTKKGMMNREDGPFHADKNATMATSLPTFDTSDFDVAAFNRGTSAILEILSPQQKRALVEYRGDEELKKRIDELAEKSNDGSLIEQERAEYEGYVRANKFVAVLQSQARKQLGNSGVE